MKNRLKIFGACILFLVFCGISAGQDTAQKTGPSHVAFAGVRSSNYGIRPFPDCDDWKKAMFKMSSYFEGSTPCGVWIVGSLAREHNCRLFFPSEGQTIEHVIFTDEDVHETYLNCFDEAGIKVFLQVEPGNADIPTLIDLVLGRYKHHKSVIGFGIDVEWFKQSEQRGWGVPVSDEEAKAWEAKVKQHNPAYRLFLKHWDRKWMPVTYRGEIIFISDSQELASLEAMVSEFSEYWADYFYPNPVYYQIGYRSDQPWWGKYDVPPRTVGEAIVQKVKQETGIFWVDFTLREVLLSDSTAIRD